MKRQNSTFKTLITSEVLYPILFWHFLILIHPPCVVGTCQSKDKVIISCFTEMLMEDQSISSSVSLQLSHRIPLCHARSYFALNPNHFHRHTKYVITNHQKTPSLFDKIFEGTQKNPSSKTFGEPEEVYKTFQLLAGLISHFCKKKCANTQRAISKTAACHAVQCK